MGSYTATIRCAVSRRLCGARLVRQSNRQVCGHISYRCRKTERCRCRIWHRLTLGKLWCCAFLLRVKFAPLTRNHTRTRTYASPHARIAPITPHELLANNVAAQVRRNGNARVLYMCATRVWLRYAHFVSVKCVLRVCWFVQVPTHTHTFPFHRLGSRAGAAAAAAHWSSAVCLCHSHSSYAQHRSW